MFRIPLALTLAASASARPAAERSLVGTWTIDTTPAISVLKPRGKLEGTIEPITLVLTGGKTPLRGTLTMWRGDVQRRDPVTGSFRAGALEFTAGAFVFEGIYDAETDVVTGTVLELPGPVRPGGNLTTFRMTR